MEYNKNPISLREGKVFIDGVECLDSVNCTIKFTPDVWTASSWASVPTAAVGWALPLQALSPAAAPTTGLRQD